MPPRTRKPRTPKKVPQKPKTLTISFGIILTSRLVKRWALLGTKWCYSETHPAINPCYARYLESKPSDLDVRDWYQRVIIVMPYRAILNLFHGEYWTPFVVKHLRQLLLWKCSSRVVQSSGVSKYHLDVLAVFF